LSERPIVRAVGQNGAQVPLFGNTGNIESSDFEWLHELPITIAALKIRFVTEMSTECKDFGVEGLRLRNAKAIRSEQM